MCFYVFAAVCFLFLSLLPSVLLYPVFFLVSSLALTFILLSFVLSFFFPHITRNLRTFGARHQASLRSLAFTWPRVDTFILFSPHSRFATAIAPCITSVPPPLTEQTAFTGIFHPSALVQRKARVSLFHSVSTKLWNRYVIFGFTVYWLLVRQPLTPTTPPTPIPI